MTAPPSGGAVFCFVPQCGVTMRAAVALPARLANGMRNGGAMKVEAMDETQRCGLTVFHDGSCPLCQREIALARRRSDPDMTTFVDVSALSAEETVTGRLTACDAMRRFHVRTADGELLSGAAAFLEMWGSTRGFSWLRTLRRTPRLVRGLDLIYDHVLLPLRPHLARWVTRRDA